MSSALLKSVRPEDLPLCRRTVVDAETLEGARKIVDEVRSGGFTALRECAERFDGLGRGAPLIYGRDELDAALRAMPADQRELLQRTADRIRNFAQAQRGSIRDISFEIPGGAAGHTMRPVASTGCYAPGGRYPLPSSVLMTVVTARVAGVERVWAASPQPAQVTLAAAAVAGADALLAAGGAHAIAALAYGAGPVAACDTVVGPGNRWVTAAKRVVAGDVAIDMLAGPSELLIVADRTADPRTVAADLLAQAEHDVDACPMLVSICPALPALVFAELDRQLATLPTAEIARPALANGFCVVVDGVQRAAEIADRIAPEHLELHLADAERAAQLFGSYGCVFIGSAGGEVLGDYGAGPNHTLPTGRTARFVGGLSVLTFLRTQTWLRISAPQDAAELSADAVALARLEGLEAHARSAAIRQSDQA